MLREQENVTFEVLDPDNSKRKVTAKKVSLRYFLSYLDGNVESLRNSLKLSDEQIDIAFKMLSARKLGSGLANLLKREKESKDWLAGFKEDQLKQVFSLSYEDTEKLIELCKGIFVQKIVEDLKEEEKIEECDIKAVYLEPYYRTNIWACEDYHAGDNIYIEIFLKRKNETGYHEAFFTNIGYFTLTHYKHICGVRDINFNYLGW